MKVVIKLIRRSKSGKKTEVTAEGDFLGTLVDLKMLWDAERAINEKTTLRCHIEVKEE